MTDKDKKLIEKARRTHYIDWHLVCDMEEQADTEEAREILHRIACSLYHREEYYVGLL